MELPVAHAEGRFVTDDEATLDSLEQNGQLALRYRRRERAIDESEDGPVGYPDNPNGSQANIAGVCDVTGRVCGLMPHPERHLDPTQHPHWTRRRLQGEGQGMQIFRNAVAYFG